MAKFIQKKYKDRQNQKQFTPTPKGTLVIIGGKENKGEEPDNNGPAE